MDGVFSMKKDMLIVKTPFFEKEIARNGSNCIPLYKSYSKFPLRLGNLTKNLHCFCKYNLNPLLEKIDECTIVVFDGGTKNNTLEWLAERYRSKRLIFYYWNPVSLSIDPARIPKSFEKWSYSPWDCNKYNLKYNSTFFFPELVGKYEDSLIKNDVFFVGKNKGRKAMLSQYEHFFQERGLKTEFVIIENTGKHLPYSEIIKKDLDSRAIFDYYTNPRAGLSLRAMESIFMGKKLITNNMSVVEYDFYNPRNIFVIGQRRNDELNAFIETPYVPISDSIIEKYTFSSWINRF